MFEWEEAFSELLGLPLGADGSIRLQCLDAVRQEFIVSAHVLGLPRQSCMLCD